MQSYHIKLNKSFTQVLTQYNNILEQSIWGSIKYHIKDYNKETVEAKDFLKMIQQIIDQTNILLNWCDDPADAHLYITYQANTFYTVGTGMSCIQYKQSTGKSNMFIPIPNSNSKKSPLYA